MASLPDIDYDYAANKTMEPRILTANLGDGYKQRAADGINCAPESWTITWINRPYADIDTLDDFFILYGGHDSFDWTPPRGSSSNKYICPNWSRTYSQPDNDDITATFIQVWDY